MRLFSIVCALVLVTIVFVSVSFAGRCDVCPNKGVCAVVENDDNPFRRLLIRKSCDDGVCRVPLFLPRTVVRKKTVIIQKDMPIKCCAPVENAVVVKEKTVETVHHTRHHRTRWIHRPGHHGPRRLAHRIRSWRPFARLRGCCH